ncbi:hypothetical protein [Cupriavidus basilensis]|uniref:Uncharacterized protein n=1 Tax=Cupriavidus basilensis TaxID=68895 RepID=A0A643FPZ6_9BURK|nr:hypothetical protein [Cupriavidus basilensis]QOT77284.1 hypothetical protein F7R26_004200 [Cupriavidus basilensis]
MSPCERCKRQAGRPGHLPPHEDLVAARANARVRDGAAYAYRCRQCGCTLVLRSPSREVPDYWALEGRAPSA